MLQIANTGPVQGNDLLAMPHTFRSKNLISMSTVLLAEDDDELRFVMECTLRSMGYCVVACADAQAATVAFSSHGHIDALLTDFEMPGRSGVELARELTSLSPALPVIVITGSALSTETMNEIDVREWIYVKKPRNLLSLQITLSRLLCPELPAA